jgi:hypothetical protein
MPVKVRQGDAATPKPRFPKTEPGAPSPSWWSFEKAKAEAQIESRATQPIDILEFRR